MKRRSHGWPSYELLYLHSHPSVLSRGAGAYIIWVFQRISRDRQIGDKRGRNYAEDKVLGPSRHLPAASDLCDLRIGLKEEKITVSITDRKDFYHQIKVSESKAVTNTLGPGLDPRCLRVLLPLISTSCRMPRSAEKMIDYVMGGILSVLPYIPPRFLWRSDQYCKVIMLELKWLVHLISSS